MPILASDRSRDATGLSALAAVATLPASFVILEPLDRLPLALPDCVAVLIVLLVLDWPVAILPLFDLRLLGDPVLDSPLPDMCP